MEQVHKTKEFTLLKNIRGIVFICISLVSCVSQKASLPYTLSDNYKNANLSHQLLILGLPDPKNIIITNPADVVDDYGGVNVAVESRIQKFYLPIIAESFRSYISGDSLMVADSYRSDFSFRDFDKKQVFLKIGQDSSTKQFTIPTKSSMQKAGLDSAIVILMDRLTFKRNNLFMEYYWDTKTKQSANLEVKADIVIWDYKSDEPVFFGTVTKQTEFMIAMNRSHWDESARSLAKKIVLSVKCL